MYVSTTPNQTSQGLEDAFIIKYDSNGNEIWTRQFGTPDDDFASGVAVDSSLGGDGGVYVIGSTNGTFPNQTSQGDQDAFIIKYDSNGNEIWTRQFGTSEYDFAFGVSVDSSGGVYVVGETGGTLTNQTSQGLEDAFIIKYDSNGNEIWTRQFGTSEYDEGIGVSVDSSGGVYVVGSTNGTLTNQTSQGLEDAFIIKYDSNGNEIWTRQFGTSEYDEGIGVSVDSSGGVYVVGETGGTLTNQTSQGDQDAFIIKYDSNGNEIWTRQFGTPDDDFVEEVSVDSPSVYVVGNIGTLVSNLEEFHTGLDDPITVIIEDAFLVKFVDDETTTE